MAILETKHYKVGYKVRTELHETDFEAFPITRPDKNTQEIIDCINNQKNKHVIIKSAYTPNDDYIGDPRTARFLIKKKGIKPEKVNPKHKVCSIGFCEKEQKWYGWSHRAMFGFGIGSVAKKGDCVCSSGWTDEYLLEHPEDDLSLPIGFTAKNLDDAKRMAIAFAESVG